MSEAIQLIVFSGTEGRLSFEVFGYERPNASDEYDANWLNTRVLIEVAAFSGSFRASLTTYDFERLNAQLRKQLTGYPVVSNSKAQRATCRFPWSFPLAVVRPYQGF